ncbi:hypothetical protein GCK72_011496 [Caenorhabditis remanei]|uniref:Uncharacterized protein n=1 Tax=Caenorhabditis remanei TaxID=31234 RepID=A0A6A5H5Y5_CAERE|nr:hypothetical protein GCK72_011496 [Caenorhabditis remanei]KAF1763230.1 hypothetical protein GCK72_011496 [Caenorhabditis remanei]
MDYDGFFKRSKKGDLTTKPLATDCLRLRFRSKVIYMLCKKENEYTYYKDIWKVMLKVCSMLEIAMQHFENNKILVWIREIKVAAVLDRNTDVFSFAHWMGESKTKHYNMEFILKSMRTLSDREVEILLTVDSNNFYEI